LVQKIYVNFLNKVICLDTGIYESNVLRENLFILIDELRIKPEFKAKKCAIVGIKPAGTLNDEWSSLSKSFTSQTLNESVVYVSFIVSK
jgi:hypothetical protein